MEYSAEFIRDILAENGKILKKSLGQNFLYDEKILYQIVDAAVEKKGENIMEIGAGVGLLTDLLCQSAKKVVTIEIDESLPPLLKNTVPHSNFSLHLQDILKADLPALADRYFGGERFVIVGNLPYYITAKILDLLALHQPLFDRSVIMVQKEVAHRLQSGRGSKEYRAATVVMQALFEIRYVCTVPPHCFVPAPHVESAVLCLTPKADSGVDDVAAFLSFVRQAFAARRKQLKSVAKNLRFTAEQMTQGLAAVGAEPAARAEDLTPTQMVQLFGILHK